MSSGSTRAKASQTTSRNKRNPFVMAKSKLAGSFTKVVDQAALLKKSKATLSNDKAHDIYS